MAGWSMIADDGSILYSSETLQKAQKSELSLELESVSNECDGGFTKGEKFDEVRRLFDQFTSVFLIETSVDSSYRPLPAMLGDGRCVDLFKLFLVVREKGGYESVSKNGLWDLVAEESGLGRRVASAVKLIYIKYLNVLERWLERVLIRDEKSGSGLIDCGTDLNVFLLQLEEELNRFLSGIADEKMEGEICPPLPLTHGLKFTGIRELFNFGKIDDMVKLERGAKCVDNDTLLDLTSGLNFTDAGSSNGEEVRAMVKMDASKKCIDDNLHLNMTGELDTPKNSCNDADITNVLESDVAKNCDDDNEDGMDLGSVVTEDVFCRKRKRGSMWGVLNWVIEAAKNPFYPAIGVIPERLKWNSYGNEVLWKQVLLARDKLFLKRELESSFEQSIWQKKQKMHPSMYDDHIGSGIGLTEKLRCSQRLLSVKNPQSRNSPETSSSATQSDMDENPSPCMEWTSNPLTEDSPLNVLINSRRQKRVRVGPLFQANIPEWTGVESESDAKWLGTQVWPLGKREKRSMIERDCIGKGRQDSCGCPLPGSGQCVGFHIGEKRMRAKLELGSAFYLWKFHKMGEDVTLSWTMEEERKFKTIVMSNPASEEKCFWSEMFKLFPNRSREELVSYYFNVFLLRRRGDQNRSTPENIDSDDDESEFGPVTNVFGRELTNSRGSILYSPNKVHKNLR